MFLALFSPEREVYILQDLRNITRKYHGFRDVRQFLDFLFSFLEERLVLEQLCAHKSILQKWAKEIASAHQGSYRTKAGRFG